MSDDEVKQLNRIVEGAIFAAGKPLSIDQIVLLFDGEERPEKKVIREALRELANEYMERGIELKELASGFQFQVKADLAKWVQRLWKEKPPRYSRAMLETLALIAYRQPITRGEIEEIRGVGVSSPMMHTLLDREWVKIVGFREVPGRPALYATTKGFLDYFGLKSLSELPPLSEIQDLDKAEEMLEEHLSEEDVVDETIEEEQVETDSPDELLSPDDNEEEIDESTIFEKVAALSEFEELPHEQSTKNDSEETE